MEALPFGGAFAADNRRSLPSCRHTAGQSHQHRAAQRPGPGLAGNHDAVEQAYPPGPAALKGRYKALMLGGDGSSLDTLTPSLTVGRDPSQTNLMRRGRNGLSEPSRSSGTDWNEQSRHLVRDPRRQAFGEENRDGGFAIDPERLFAVFEPQRPDQGTTNKGTAALPETVGQPETDPTLEPVATNA